MIDSGGRERLSVETLPRDGIFSHGRGEELQRDPSLESGVEGQINDPHAALAQFTLDRVAALQGCVETRDGIGHGRTPGPDGSNILCARR